MPPDPYSRSYWRFPDEYPGVYADDSAYALWCRLRDLADMAWPSAGTLPAGVKKRALTMLTDAELIFLQPGGRYRVRGMDKHRGQRQESARIGAEARWARMHPQSNGNANAMRPQSERNATAMHIPSRAEQREESRPPAMPDEEKREHLDTLRDTLIANGAMPAAKARKALTPKPAETDEQVISRCQAIVADAEAPDWKRDAAREQLELMGVR
jgi:hypothetical protein